MARERLPYWQVYPGDIRKDVAFQTLSYHYRGIWWELLMLMHCSEDRGRLVSNGAPIGTPGVARLLGLSEKEAEQAIQVLTSSGVASRDESGALICRRMVREQDERKAVADRVYRYRKKKQTCNARCNGDVTPNDSDGDSLNSVNAKKRAASIDEVLQFCRDLGLPRTDAEWFWHKCEGNGWQNGGKAILDWRQTLRSWRAGGYVPSIKNPRKGVAPPAEKRPPKPQPEGWLQWVAENYPGSSQRNYWLAPGDVQREFNGR